MPPDIVWFTTADLARRYGKSVRTIRDWNTRKLKNMPSPIKDPSGHLRWLVADILKWEKTLILTAAALAICQLELPFDPCHLI